ncbi:proton channel OtopLc-like [Galleria mellonella]|uniref:Proton channel OtopLc-like n=1 Tax=Galleria mellonella TaxID=7137 RepID=A0ABM3MJJ7_GALME|nr:proton channel OtopLc-like [Galleria mellonella]
MAEINIDKTEILDEIKNRKNMGDKKFHSESSLQNYVEEDEFPGSKEEEDPGVQNVTINNLAVVQDRERKRAMSQPGPNAGGMITATVARAARRRPRVVYADDVNDPYDKQSTKSTIPKGDESGMTTPNGNYRMYTSVNDMRNGMTPRKRSVATMDAQSLRSVETHAPPPTSPEDNIRQTKKYLTLMFSCMYAIILVTLGVIIYLGDLFVECSVSAIYSILLCSIGILYHIYLIIDIGRYKNKALKNQKIKTLHEEKMTQFFRTQEEEFNVDSPGERTPEFSYKTPSVPPPLLNPLSHDYCFSHGRHSGSFYLKLGAAGFALGHLIHSMLLFAVQISLLVDEDIDNDDCIDYLQLTLDVMSPIYCFLQLYFIFKYSNVIILRAQSLAYIAFMHMIGSSLCFWISAIVRETILALTIYANSVYGNGYGNNYTTTTVAPEVKVVTEDPNIRLSMSRIFDVSGLYNPQCIGPPAVNSIYENFSPYLYPFTVEFNILIVAVYYIIWSNIGHCPNEDNAGNSELNSSLDDNFPICKIPTANEDNDFTSNVVIHADCHASNRGLFLGLIVTVIIAGMLILGFVFSSVGDELLEVGYLLNDCTKLGLHCIMLIAVVFAYNQLRQLDINEHPISLLDDVLLFICLPAFILETVLSMVATVNILNVVKTIDFIVMIVQVFIQTPFIMDGLRRCSNSKKHRRRKPGRELLMFLLIINVGMWLFNTFSYKSPDSLDERYTFYGKVLWSILGHISLPLIMFYRFHSSVCFADIWNSAYKPGSEH